MPRTYITPWYSRPAALSVLAICAANPPKAESRTKRYAQTRDEWTTYVGHLVDLLTEAKAAAFAETEAYALTQLKGEYSPIMRAAGLTVTVDMAIDAVRRDGHRITWGVDLPVISFDVVEQAA